MFADECLAAAAEEAAEDECDNDDVVELARDWAVAEAQGDGWRAELDPALAAGLRRRRPWLHILFTPHAVRRRDVERIRDLSYGDAGREHLLDLYRPRSGITHANYRRRPASRFPAQLVDAKRVIAWVREHGSEYTAQPSSVFVVGGSAGAHLAALTALTQNAPVLQLGFEQADTSVAGAICLYGFYGSPTWIECEPGAPSSPAALVDADAPPMCIVHGELDSFVSVEQARSFSPRRPESTSPLRRLREVVDLDIGQPHGASPCSSAMPPSMPSPSLRERWVECANSTVSVCQPNSRV